MGLFDTLLIPIPCPKCGRIIREWQTKDLDPCMDEYRPGERVPTVCSSILAHGRCEHGDKVILQPDEGPTCGQVFRRRCGWYKVEVLVTKTGRLSRRKPRVVGTEESCVDVWVPGKRTLEVKGNT